ncbi:MAG: GHKL domain-containing protein [Clostridia bacterium]|nr:GHKL domain-containing protein [Clostridia bacterium]
MIKTKEKLFFTETHINSQIAHYEELYKHQTELRIFRHDIKNILLSLMGILKESDTEKALQVMQANLDMLDETSKNIVNTGHPITDAILQSKLHDANTKGIKLCISTKLTEKIIVDELELGIVLGNALDNAIEAAARVKDIPEKVVAFDMITTAERIIITIENPVDGNVNTNKLITSKKDKENHGYGVGSIKTIARKYDGVAEFTCNDGRFITNINMANIKPKR